MNLFYLDTEHSNGNFYLGDIFDLTLISGKSGNVFHTLINIPTPLDSYVKFMCNITDNKLHREGTTFEQAFEAMITFVNDEIKEEMEEELYPEVTIIAHSGYLHDFPLLVTNCIKNKCNTAAMYNYCFIDTLQILQKEAEDNSHNTVFSLETHNNLPQSLALKSLAKKVIGHTTMQLHDSHKDAKTLMQVFRHEPYRSILMRNINNNTYDVNSIYEYLYAKMPISIDDMYKLATQAESPHQLALLLSTHVREKTALNKSTVAKIAFYYLYFKRC